MRNVSKQVCLCNISREGTIYADSGKFSILNVQRDPIFFWRKLHLYRSTDDRRHAALRLRRFSKNNLYHFEQRSDAGLELFGQVKAFSCNVISAPDRRELTALRTTRGVPECCRLSLGTPEISPLILFRILSAFRIQTQIQTRMKALSQIRIVFRIRIASLIQTVFPTRASFPTRARSAVCIFQPVSTTCTAF